MVGRNGSRASLYGAAISDKKSFCIHFSSHHHKFGTWYICPGHSAMGVLVKTGPGETYLKIPLFPPPESPVSFCEVCDRLDWQKMNERVEI